MPSGELGYVNSHERRVMLAKTEWSRLPAIAC